MADAGIFKAGYVINDRFEIKRLLGQGGFAMVFEGTDRNLDRQVAIKILHGAVLANTTEDHRVIERFEREAKLAASVDHPSVVNIYDAGEIEGLGEPFIVMEYLKGQSLQDYLDDHGPMPPEKLLPLFKDVLMGLGYAHELGIVHKDLKPDNIFYRYPGSMRESLCIVDFGIAHIGRSNSGRVTRDGEFFGTPSYMPPEYISEQKVSAMFDVYQMGLILIECLTGQSVVHHEDAVATLLMHLNRQFRIPACLLESEAWPVVERAIASNPAIRYENALRFAEALHSLSASAWPSHTQLAQVAMRGDVTDLPTAQGEFPAGLGDTETEVEDDFADMWQQEDALRTETYNDRPTQSGKIPFDAKPYVPEPEATPVKELPASQPESNTSAAASVAIDPTEEVVVSDASMSMEIPAQGKGGNLAVVAGVIAVMILIAGGVVVALLGKDDATPEGPIAGQTTNTPDMSKGAVATTDIKGSSEIVPPAEVPDQGAPKKEAPTPVKIVLNGEPSGAVVSTLDGKKLGQTPYTVEFVSLDDVTQTLIVSHDDYDDAQVEISPKSGDGEQAYTLKKTVVASKKSSRGSKSSKSTKASKAADSSAAVAKKDTTPPVEEKKEPVKKAEPVKIELLGSSKTSSGSKDTKKSVGIVLPK